VLIEYIMFVSGLFPSSPSNESRQPPRVCTGGAARDRRCRRLAARRCPFSAAMRGGRRRREVGGTPVAISKARSRGTVVNSREFFFDDNLSLLSVEPFFPLMLGATDRNFPLLDRLSSKKNSYISWGHRMVILKGKYFFAYVAHDEIDFSYNGI